MDRRTALGGLTMLAAAAMAGSASAETPLDQEHMHHHGKSNNQALIDSTGNCMNTGEVCLAHCILLLGEGDKSMAECATNVNQMLSICRALHDLAAQQSPYLPAMARIALDTCKACQDACKQHADKHQECKDCMNAGEVCAKECAKIAA
ncbi:MAG: four-helix bundle copper-binding protein [Chromatiaceae bacterium]|mgnify:CR=1 FL=1|nr:four-helix bundle copper-binding protein [Chromatiaceae bacterium]